MLKDYLKFRKYSYFFCIIPQLFSLLLFVFTYFFYNEYSKILGVFDFDETFFYNWINTNYQCLFLAINIAISTFFLLKCSHLKMHHSNFYIVVNITNIAFSFAVLFFNVFVFPFLSHIILYISLKHLSEDVGYRGKAKINVLLFFSLVSEFLRSILIYLALSDFRTITEGIVLFADSVWGILLSFQSFNVLVSFTAMHIYKALETTYTQELNSQRQKTPQ